MSEPTGADEGQRQRRARPRTPQADPAVVAHVLAAKRTELLALQARVQRWKDDRTEEARSPIPVAQRGKVMPAEWADPADHSIFRKKRRRVSGKRRVDPLIRLVGDQIEMAHFLAAECFRRDWEASQRGTVRLSSVEPRISGAGTGGPTDRMLDASAAFSAADATLAQVRNAHAIVHAAVLGDTTGCGVINVRTWAERCGEDKGRAMGFLISGLDLLRHHYRHQVQTALDHGNDELEFAV